MRVAQQCVPDDLERDVVLKSDRANDGCIFCGSVGMRSCLRIGHEDFGEASIRESADRSGVRELVAAEGKVLGWSSIWEAFARGHWRTRSTEVAFNPQ